MHKPASLLLTILLLSTSVGVLAAPIDVPVLSPEQLDNYQFPSKPETPAVVDDLSFGQLTLLDQQREEIQALFSRRLGVMSLKNTQADLSLYQQLVDRRLIRPDQITQWQALGVVFGDLLVREFGLHWVSYEDALGSSKALRWRTTDNFIFPVTVFSKRVQFNEKIDVKAI
ncbi:DUF3806 domain-containing protein, partial [Pseudomonadales bacterium]|nr:DUF3806 domain-containing protein [Pseudomonadales bacterium]